MDNIRWDEFSTAPGTANPHPSDAELDAANRDTNKHVTDCAYCQQRLQGHEERRSAFDAAVLDDETFEHSLRARLDGGGRDRLKASTALSPALHSFTQVVNVREDVRPGQIWRLRWAQQQMLVAVLSVRAWWVDVAPVTTDVLHADEYTWRLPGHATTLGVPLAVVVSAEATVPLFTFERLVSDLADTLGPDSAGSAAALRSALRNARPAPRGMDVGPFTGEMDVDRGELRASLQSQLAVFGGAYAHRTETSAAEELADVLMEHSQGNPDAFNAFGIGAIDMLELTRGARLTAAQAEALSTALKMPAEQLLALNPPLPDAAIVEVSRPVLRASFEELAGGNDEAMSQRRWEVAERALAAAARETGAPHARGKADGPDGGDPTLAVKVRHILEQMLDEVRGLR